jgi:hypothetical protein
MEGFTMKKKIVCLIAAISLMACQVAPCYAADQDYDTLKQEYDELLEKYNEAIQRIEELEGKSEPTDLLYEGKYGTLTLSEIKDDGIVFLYNNTTDEDYNVFSDYITLDGVEYDEGWDDDYTIHTGGIEDAVASGTERELFFSLDTTNIDVTKISGQFIICEFSTGNTDGLISFQNVSIQ